MAADALAVVVVAEGVAVDANLMAEVCGARAFNKVLNIMAMFERFSLRCTFRSLRMTVNDIVRGPWMLGVGRIRPYSSKASLIGQLPSRGVGERCGALTRSKYERAPPPWESAYCIDMGLCLSSANSSCIQGPDIKCGPAAFGKFES